MKTKKIAAYIVTIFLFFGLLHAGQIQWSFPPDLLSTPGQNGSDPQIAIDGSGNLVAIWVEAGVVKARSKSNGGSWESIATVSGSGASAPSLVIDGSGSATAIWIEGGVVMTASKPLSSGWGSATTLSATGAASPHIAVSPGDDLVAVWANGDALESATRLAGGSWPASPDSIASSSVSLPQVAVNGSGGNYVAVAVWHSNSTQDVCAATKLISGAWSAQQTISDTAHAAGNAKVAVDSNGTACALWYQYDVVGSDNSNVIVQAATKLSGGNWSAPESLSDPGIRNPLDLSVHIGFDSDGDAMGLWTNSYDGSAYTIESRTKLADENWDVTNYLNANIGAFFIDLNVNARGDAYAIFSDLQDPLTIGISLSKSRTLRGPGRNYWCGSRLLSYQTSNGYPQIAITNDQTSAYGGVIWVAFDGQNNTIQAVAGSATLLLPPTNLAVVQSVHDLGVVNEYYNTLSWQASLSADVARYLIFRNGKVLGFVDASVTSWVDHNRTQGESVTYGICAISDKCCDRSSMATITFP